MSDLANNINTVRVAAKDAYGPTGIYPTMNSAATIAVRSPTALLTDTASNIGKLVALGKLSPDEALNGISGNYFDVGGAALGGRPNAGYVIEVNGLTQQQCRGILNQVANQWDFVQVKTDAAGVYTTPANVNLNAAAGATVTPAPAGTPPTVALDPDGIYRSLAVDGSILLGPDAIVGACNDNANNAIVLGSR